MMQMAYSGVRCEPLPTMRKYSRGSNNQQPLKAIACRPLDILFLKAIQMCRSCCMGVHRSRVIRSPCSSLFVRFAVEISQPIDEFNTRPSLRPSKIRATTGKRQDLWSRQGMCLGKEGRRRLMKISRCMGA